MLCVLVFVASKSDLSSASGIELESELAGVGECCSRKVGKDLEIINSLYQTVEDRVSGEEMSFPQLRCLGCCVNPRGGWWGSGTVQTAVHDQNAVEQSSWQQHL